MRFYCVVYTKREKIKSDDHNSSSFDGKCEQGFRIKCISLNVVWYIFVIERTLKGMILQLEQIWHEFAQ